MWKNANLSVAFPLGLPSLSLFLFKNEKQRSQNGLHAFKGFLKERTKVHVIVRMHMLQRKNSSPKFMSYFRRSRANFCNSVSLSKFFEVHNHIQTLVNAFWTVLQCFPWHYKSGEDWKTQNLWVVFPRCNPYHNEFRSAESHSSETTDRCYCNRCLQLLLNLPFYQPVRVLLGRVWDILYNVFF